MTSRVNDDHGAASSKKSTKIIEPAANEAIILIPPDGGWGWLVVFGAFVSYFIADGLQYSFGIFLQDMSSTLACTTSQVALAGGICTCVFCVSGPFSAALVNRYGYRAISIAGAILASISCLLTSFSQNIYLVIVYHGFIGGLGFGMIYITALIAVGFYFERWRGLATGVAVCGAGIGGITLPPILTLIMRQIGWRHTFQCLSGFSLLIIGCGCLFRPLRPTRLILNNPQPPTNRSDAKMSHVSFFEKYQNKNFNTLLDQRSVYNDSSEQLFSTMYTSESPNHSDSLHDSRKDAARRRCCPWTSCRRRHSKRHMCRSRPIYRDDIFFTGSLAMVPEYRSAQVFESRPNLDYQLSVTRMSTTHQALPYRRKCCPNSIKRTLATMLDFRMMKSFKFQMLIMNAMFVSLGIYIPYMFIKANAMMHDITEDLSSWLISTIGITNTFGRIMCGLLSTSPRVSSLAMCYTFLFVGGVATIASTVSYVLWVQFLYCATFGLAMSSISALRTLIIVKMVGLENLTNAIGIILLFQGIASLCGLAIAGQLWDMTNDYRYSFYFGGSCLSIAAIFLIILHVKQFQEDKARQNI